MHKIKGQLTWSVSSSYFYSSATACWHWKVSWHWQKIVPPSELSKNVVIGLFSTLLLFLSKLEGNFKNSDVFSFTTSRNCQFSMSTLWYIFLCWGYPIQQEMDVYSTCTKRLTTGGLFLQKIAATTTQSRSNRPASKWPRKRTNLYVWTLNTCLSSTQFFLGRYSMSTGCAMLFGGNIYVYLYSR
jgi:hypothetical protein